VLGSKLNHFNNVCSFQFVAAKLCKIGSLSGYCLHEKHLNNAVYEETPTSCLFLVTTLLLHSDVLYRHISLAVCRPKGVYRHHESLCSSYLETIFLPPNIRYLSFLLCWRLAANSIHAQTVCVERYGDVMWRRAITNPTTKPRDIVHYRQSSREINGTFKYGPPKWSGYCTDNHVCLAPYHTSSSA